MIWLSSGYSRYGKIALIPKNQHHTLSVAGNTLNVHLSQGTRHYTWFPDGTSKTIGVLILRDTQSVSANALCL